MSVRCEAADASAAMFGAAARLRDEIGLSSVGLRMNDWEVEEAPGTRVAAPAASGKPPEPSLPPAGDPRDRLRVVTDADG
jgi:hypothetical protein